jgi:hypothetical protein
MATTQNIKIQQSVETLQATLRKSLNFKERGKYVRLFYAALTQEVFRLIHEDFMLKTTGQPDKDGNKWAPLAPSTFWKRLYTHALSLYSETHTPDKVKNRAARYAWQAIATATTTLINVRTHRLEKSLRPGKLSQYSYVPPSEQIFEVSRKGLTLGTEVPYAPHVHKKRPILPNQEAMVERILPQALAFATSKVHSQLAQDLRNNRSRK